MIFQVYTILSVCLIRTKQIRSWEKGYSTNQFSTASNLLGCGLCVIAYTYEYTGIFYICCTCISRFAAVLHAKKQDETRETKCHGFVSADSFHHSRGKISSQNWVSRPETSRWSAWSAGSPGCIYLGDETRRNSTHRSRFASELWTDHRIHLKTITGAIIDNLYMSPMVESMAPKNEHDLKHQICCPCAVQKGNRKHYRKHQVFQDLPLTEISSLHWWKIARICRKAACTSSRVAPRKLLVRSQLRNWPPAPVLVNHAKWHINQAQQDLSTVLMSKHDLKVCCLDSKWLKAKSTACS